MPEKNKKEEKGLAKEMMALDPGTIAANMPMDDLFAEMNKMQEQTNKMAEQLNKMTDDLVKQTFTGSSANKLVTVVIDHDFFPKSIEIDPSLLDPQKKEALKAAIIGAFRQAITSGRKYTENNLSKLSEFFK
jgi:nucleoid-associated protein EbfC